MDRFFSKLDLRDIKIDPEASYPPTEDGYNDDEPVAAWTNGDTNGDASEDFEESALLVETERSDVLKVSARSRPSAVAGAIAGVVRESGRAEVQAIGAGATNQAVKAVAIARDYLRETDIDAICLPAFIDVMIEDENRTAIRLIVEAR